jgi:hypothetical protein
VGGADIYNMDLPKTKKIKKKSKNIRSNSNNSSSYVISPKAGKLNKVESKELPNYMRPTKKIKSPSPKNENLYKP